jgi:hypothetical protein
LRRRADPGNGTPLFYAPRLLFWPSIVRSNCLSSTVVAVDLSAFDASARSGARRTVRSTVGALLKITQINRIRSACDARRFDIIAE